MNPSSTPPFWRGRRYKLMLRPLVTLALLGASSTAVAQVSPWVNQVAVTGDQQFAIYDRFIPGLVENPVYQRPEATVDPTVRPAGVVRASTVSLWVDLHGQVPLGEGGILVRLTPPARIREYAPARPARPR